MAGPARLTFNEDKTSIVHLDEGLDFLGFNVRRHSGKLLIKPSKAAIRRIRQKLRAEMRSLRGSNAAGVLRAVNPVVRGWAAYYRGWCPGPRQGVGMPVSGSCDTEQREGTEGVAGVVA